MGGASKTREAVCGDDDEYFLSANDSDAARRVTAAAEASSSGTTATTVADALREASEQRMKVALLEQEVVAWSRRCMDMGSHLQACSREFERLLLAQKNNTKKALEMQRGKMRRLSAAVKKNPAVVAALADDDAGDSSTASTPTFSASTVRRTMMPEEEGEEQGCGSNPDAARIEDNSKKINDNRKRRMLGGTTTTTGGGKDEDYDGCSAQQGQNKFSCVIMSKNAEIASLKKELSKKENKIRVRSTPPPPPPNASLSMLVFLYGAFLFRTVEREFNGNRPCARVYVAGIDCKAGGEGQPNT